MWLPSLCLFFTFFWFPTATAAKDFVLARHLQSVLSGEASSNSSNSSNSSAPVSGNYTAEFLSSLTAIAPSFANVLKASNITRTSNYIFDILQGGVGAGSGNGTNGTTGFTMLVPQDEAVSGSSLASMDTPTLSNYLAYHILRGNLSSPKDPTGRMIQSSPFPRNTLARTLLHDPSLVALERNISQVLVWADFGEGRGVEVLNQNQGQESPINITIAHNCTSFLNIFACPISSVLSPPLPFASVINHTAWAYGLRSFEGFINTQHNPLTHIDGTETADGLKTIAESISESSGITVFAPSNDAFLKASEVMTQMAQDRLGMETLMMNHIINGTTLYSPYFTTISLSPPTNLTSPLAQPITFHINETGSFVFSGVPNSDNFWEAMILETRTDILMREGVVHVIDAVFLNTGTARNGTGTPTQTQNNNNTQTQTSQIQAQQTGETQTQTETETTTLGPTPNAENVKGNRGSPALSVPIHPLFMFLDLVDGLGEDAKMVITSFVGVMIWGVVGAWVV